MTNNNSCVKNVKNIAVLNTTNSVTNNNRAVNLAEIPIIKIVQLKFHSISFYYHYFDILIFNPSLDNK